MAPSPQHATPRLFLTKLLSLFCLFPNVTGYIQKHIIDDTDSSIQYSPNGWSRGNLCAICSEGLDLNQIHGKTWINGSTLRGSGETPVFFTFFFTGIDLEIFFIAQAVHPISNSTQGVLNDANATIAVDGESVSYFKQLVQGSDKNQLVGYNKSLYAQSWTTNSKHDVRVDLAPLGSTLSLDYIAYSVEVDDEVSPNGGLSPTGEIEMTSRWGTSERGKVIAIGVATGVSALLALTAFFAWWYVRRKRAAQNALQQVDHIINITPSEPPPTTPTNRSREKLSFPSDASSSSALSPTTTAMTRQQHVFTFSSSTSLSSLPLLPLSTSTVGSPQSGDNMDDVPPPAYSPPSSIKYSTT